MSRKALKEKSFLDEEEAEEKEIGRAVPHGYVPWSNPNELQATNRNSRQGPGTSCTRRMGSSARHQDTSPGAEALSQPEPVGLRRRHSPVFTEETRPGVFLVPGIGDDGLTIEERYDEQSTIASSENSTIQLVARTVNTEEENWRLRALDRAVREQERMRHELDQAAREQERMRHELDQAAYERDQLRHVLNNAPIVTPVVAPKRDEENGDESIHANHDDLQINDDPKCSKRGKRWFAVIAILLIVVAVAVTLALVLQPEPTPPPDPLSELLSSASSDGGAALADPSTPQYMALKWLAGDPNVASYTDQQQIQRYALATLYYSTKGNSWNNEENWLSYEPVCGKWYDYYDTTIGCTADGISSLGLFNNNLQGSIPPEIGMLSNSLEELWLPKNVLEGGIPTEIGELTKMSSLSLKGNSLKGTIPNELGLLTKLTSLTLSENGFTGTVPTSLASLTLLKDLYLYDNDLTGSVDALCGIYFENFYADCEEIDCECCSATECCYLNNTNLNNTDLNNTCF